MDTQKTTGVWTGDSHPAKKVLQTFWGKERAKRKVLRGKETKLPEKWEYSI